MSNMCELTGISVLHGNNVSHSNRKTRRVFLPNIQKKKFFFPSIGVNISLKIAAKVLRTIDAKGGIENYLTITLDKVLSKRMQKIKRQLVRKQIIKDVNAKN